MSKREDLRIVVLFSRLSGYTSKCLRVLCDRHDAEILVFRKAPTNEAPFEKALFEWIERLHDRAEFSARQILEKTLQFTPDAIFLAGWEYRDYLKVSRSARGREIPVVSGSDKQWRGSLRQQIGRLIAPWYLHSAIDVLWVPGERQRQFADRLGYRGKYCWSGYYCCDWERFAEVHQGQTSTGTRLFLFVGRYVLEKGLDVLLDGYALYRKCVDDPWGLVCAGAGPLKPRVRGEGVVDVGFTQPDDLPKLMEQATAFVLPSRCEPWGVALQEAAAAGLPVICSEACGASAHLLQDGYNGRLCEAGDAQDLARCMLQMHETQSEHLTRMGQRSHQLSRQFTPQRWANTLARGIEEL